MASERCTSILLGILAVICSCTDAQYFYLTPSRYPPGDIREGSDVTFTCEISSYDNPDIEVWIKWQYTRDLWTSESSTSLTKPILVTTGSHSLTLRGVSGHQIGYYRCVGKNYWSQGYWSPDRSSPWSSLPLVTYRPFVISENRTWIGANDNDTATLTCYLQSKPRPYITWYGPNGTNITAKTDPDRVVWENRYEELRHGMGYKTTSTLTIQQVNTTTDYGVYMCRADNGIGSFVDHEIELKETGTPDPPKHLQVYRVYSSIISVKWDLGYDGGEELEYHFINFRKIPEEFDPLTWIRLTRYETSEYISYLKNDTVYQVAVYATNRLGSSPYATVTARTKPGSPTNMGISVSYNSAKCTFVVTGIPQDDDNATCLKIGRDFNVWVSLGPDLDCIQSDGEFEYCGNFTTYFYSRYCRDDVCGASSYVSYESCPPDNPTGDQWSTLEIITFCVYITSLLALLAPLVQRRYRRYRRRTKNNPPDSNVDRNENEEEATIDEDEDRV